MDLYWRGSSKYKTHASDWSNNMRQAKLYKKKIREAERKIDTLTFQLAFEERREEVENERPSV